MAAGPSGKISRGGRAAFLARPAEIGNRLAMPRPSPFSPIPDQYRKIAAAMAAPGISSFGRM